MICLSKDILLISSTLDHTVELHLNSMNNLRVNKHLHLEFEKCEQSYSVPIQISLELCHYIHMSFCFPMMTMLSQLLLDSESVSFSESVLDSVLSESDSLFFCVLLEGAK